MPPKAEVDPEDRASVLTHAVWPWNSLEEHEEHDTLELIEEKLRMEAWQRLVAKLEERHKVRRINSYLDADTASADFEEDFGGTEDITTMAWCFLCSRPRPHLGSVGTAAWATLSRLHEAGISYVCDSVGQAVSTHLEGEVCPRCLRNALVSHQTSKPPSEPLHARLPPECLHWTRHRTLARSSQVQDLDELVVGCTGVVGSADPMPPEVVAGRYRTLIRSSQVHDLDDLVIGSSGAVGSTDPIAQVVEASSTAATRRVSKRRGRWFGD